MTTSFEHPFVDTIARVAKLSDYLRVQLGLPHGDGWVAPAELFAPASEQLPLLISATERRLRTKAVNVVGSALLQSYQWSIIAAGIACYLLDRRVPNLTTDNVRLHLSNDGKIDGIALLESTCVVLPTDSAANHASVRLAPDLAALRTELRLQLEEHLGLVITHLCDQIGCKPRGLWLAVADGCVGMLVWLMQVVDPDVHTSTMAQEVEALVRVPNSPLHNRKVGLFTLTYAEQTATHFERSTCCYWYKTEGGNYCATCPHRAAENRNAQLLEHMAEQYAAA